MIERDQFGPFLRRERERRGITLQDIATRTKIGAALFAALERNDFSRWPGGIYRRSFVRAYAEAVGLDAERTVANFVRLFPVDEAEHAAHLVASNPGKASRGERSAGRRATMAAVELAAVGTVSAAIGMTLDWLYAWPLLGVGAAVAVVANVRRTKNSSRSATIGADPAPSTATPARQIAKRPSAERHNTSRRHRPRRPGSRRPRA
jgi:transcriptional regulator with XRE-family HTH domain